MLGESAAKALLAEAQADAAMGQLRFALWTTLPYLERDLTATQTWDNADSGASVTTFGVGGGSASVQGAPLPLAGEAFDAYMRRAMNNPAWKPGSGGFNLGAPGTWAPALQDAANALQIVAAAFGLAGASQLVYTLHAVAGHGSPSELESALKSDWQNFQMSGGLAQAVETGDWKKAWDVVTTNGKELGELQHAFSPGAAPDASGRLTIKQPTGVKAMAIKLIPIQTSLIQEVAHQAAAQGQTPAQFLRSAPAVGLAPPPITPKNPQGGRTFMGVPLVDLAAAGAVLGGLGYVFRAKLGL